jgi:hypothetical protein
MKKFTAFMNKYGLYLYLLCALTSFLTKEYTSTSLWICLFCAELATRDTDSEDNSSQSEDGSTSDNK